MRAWRVIILCVIAACASLIGIDDPQVGSAVGSCTNFPCDVVPQCGCGPGSACEASSQGNSCRIAGSGTESAICTADPDCAAGYACSAGHCVRYCSQDSDCESPRGRCLTALGGSSVVSCTSGCDPLSTTNTDCPGTWSCDYVRFGSDSSNDSLICRAPGTAGPGSSCASATCQTGLTCVHFSTGADTCEYPCAPTANPACPHGGTCHGFSTAFVVAGTEYGACD